PSVARQCLSTRNARSTPQEQLPTRLQQQLRADASAGLGRNASCPPLDGLGAASMSSQRSDRVRSLCIEKVRTAIFPGCEQQHPTLSLLLRSKEAHISCDGFDEPRRG